MSGTIMWFTYLLHLILVIALCGRYIINIYLSWVIKLKLRMFKGQTQYERDNGGGGLCNGTECSDLLHSLAANLGKYHSLLTSHSWNIFEFTFFPYEERTMELSPDLWPLWPIGQWSKCLLGKVILNITLYPVLFFS